MMIPKFLKLLNVSDIIENNIFEIKNVNRVAGLLSTSLNSPVRNVGAGDMDIASELSHANKKTIFGMVEPRLDEGWRKHRAS